MPAAVDESLPTAKAPLPLAGVQGIRPRPQNWCPRRDRSSSHPRGPAGCLHADAGKAMTKTTAIAEYPFTRASSPA
jgi:hypothetical protein